MSRTAKGVSCLVVSILLLSPKTGLTTTMAQQQMDMSEQREECVKPDASTISTSLDPDTYQLVTRIESRFNCELRNQQRAVNALPQRLLSDAAKEAIKESLEQDLTAQIEQLRKTQQDLQRQINELKHHR
jgi:hypothetical protein